MIFDFFFLLSVVCESNVVFLPGKFEIIEVNPQFLIWVTTNSSNYFTKFTAKYRKTSNVRNILPNLPRNIRNTDANMRNDLNHRILRLIWCRWEREYAGFTFIEMITSFHLARWKFCVRFGLKTSTFRLWPRQEWRINFF